MIVENVRVSSWKEKVSKEEFDWVTYIYPDKEIFTKVTKSLIRILAYVQFE